MSTAKKTATSASKQTKGRGKKRAAVDEEEEENGTSSSTALKSVDLAVDSSASSSSASSSSSSSSATGDEDAARLKRLKSMASSMSKHLTCAISQELMVDPVLAADGNTYERFEILKWIATKSTSPLDPSCPLDASRLMSNRAVKQQIEELVASGELADELRADYLERKKTSSLEHAQELYDEGKEEEAAALGLPKAQGFMAEMCFERDEEGDQEKGVEWAEKAAAGGDDLGQFWLGHAYQKGAGSLGKDYAIALEWYEKAADQGNEYAMTNIGQLHDEGGRGVTQNKLTAVSWYRKAAEAGNETGQYNLGFCYYKGEGVTKNLATARSWFQSAADQEDDDAIRRLGYMMVKGEGGEQDVKGGIDLWQSLNGDEKAQRNLDKLYRCLSNAHFEAE
jgi:TPR repeat protein